VGRKRHVVEDAHDRHLGSVHPNLARLNSGEALRPERPDNPSLI
jgi:hypothetical protein